MTDLEQVAAKLNNVIFFDSNPMAHVHAMRALFERRCKHSLKPFLIEGLPGGHGC